MADDPTPTGDRPPTGDPTPTGGVPAAEAGVLVRYFAGARAAAGVPTDHLPGGLSLDELVGRLVARRGDRLGTVLAAASFLVDGVRCHDRGAPLATGTTVDVLPPFAGG